MKTETQEEHHGKTEAEIGVREPQAQECRGLQAVIGTWDRRTEQNLPHNSQKEPTLTPS